MAWAVRGHDAFHKELNKLPGEDEQRVREALRNLRDHLERVGSVNPGHVLRSQPLSRVPDLRPLHAADTPGSYRLRTGNHRVALTILPDEQMVAVTGVAQRDQRTYDKLVERHDTRMRDR